MNMNRVALTSLFHQKIESPDFFLGAPVKRKVEPGSEKLASLGYVAGFWYNSPLFEASEGCFGSEWDYNGWAFIVLWTHYDAKKPMPDPYYAVVRAEELELDPKRKAS